MTQEETLYTTIGHSFEYAEQSQMFGKSCFKIKGKAFICFFQNEMVFKLLGDTHQEALALAGSRLFDPSGKQRPMKEWVHVSTEHKDKWKAFAEAAMKYVTNLKHVMQ